MEEFLCIGSNKDYINFFFKNLAQMIGVDTVISQKKLGI